VDVAPAPDSSGSPNCVNLPLGPLATTRVPGIDPVEDITFDDSGNLYWNAIDGGIVKSRADGSSTLFVPRVKFNAGLRWTPSGDLYIATDKGLEKVSPNGARTVVVPLGGDGFNGIEVDRQGRVYVSDLPDSLIQRYDPQANRSDLITKGVIQAPNGLTFSPSFDMLYVGHFGRPETPTLYQIPIGKDGTAGSPEVWVTNVGTGTYDGMAADECGNIYVSNSEGAGEILRFSPDGKTHTVLVARPGENLHNLVWGRGQGWPETKLYIVSLGNGLFEVDPGVRGKKYW
jgi:sugar lactone lactonase YvrE